MANQSHSFGDAWEKKEGVRVWVGNGGVYHIPPRLHSVRITRKGWPNKRDPGYAAFMEWVNKQEQKAQNG